MEDYFALRGERYRGSKAALAALQVDAPATFAAFERALAPGATDEALESVVNCVVE